MNGGIGGNWSVCCSYRVTLNQNEKTEDEEEQNKRLKDCHQRCADRTLKVLEKNGSIFIKLGQHLVGGMILEFGIAADTFSECDELPPTPGMDYDLYTFTRQMPCLVIRINRNDVWTRYG
jgi:hypothetical protein